MLEERRQLRECEDEDKVEEELEVRNATLDRLGRHFCTMLGRAEVRQMERKNLDIYGHAPIPWSRALKQLAANNGTYWLATTRPGAGPHLAAVGGLWVDGNVYFTSGPRTRKSRDIAKHPGCVVSVSLKDLDVVIEGTARKVKDEATLKRLAKLYGAQGWPAVVRGGAFTYEYSAPSAGPPPWHLYVIAPVTAFGVATAEPHGATRWRFGDALKVKRRAARRA